MAYRELPSVEFLRQCLDYNPDTGLFIWKFRPRALCKSDKAWRVFNTKFPGKPALTAYSDQGYRQGRIDGVLYAAHRIAYLMGTGEYPAGEIDHINGVRDDNSLSNLRCVTKSVNSRNRCKAPSSRPYTGVDFKKGRWFAEIKCSGKYYFLGVFDTPEEAIVARKAAEADLGFHPNHGRSDALARDIVEGVGK